MTIVQDLRNAIRTLVRMPSFTVPVLLSIAFAIGANVAAFSILNTLALRTIPVREPQRLFQVTHGGDGGTLEGSNYAWYEQVRDGAHSIESAALERGRTGTKVVVQGEVELVNGLQVSGSYFPTLGIDAALGRLIAPSDQSESGPARVAVIGDGYWTRRFGRDPKVLGRTIVIDQTPYEVVGVTPPAFFGLQVGQRVDVTVPMDAESLRRGWRSMPLVVRLPADGSPDTATSELTTMFRRFVDGPNPMGFGKPIAQGDKDARFKFVALQPLTSGLGALREQFMRPAVALMVLVAVMLLLACANWATLATARASARRRDLTICLALGSTRAQLARSMFIESLLLAVAGGVAGFFASWWAVGLLVRYLPTYGQPIDLHVDPDVRVLGFTLAISLATGLVFGVAPAWLTGRIEASELRTAGTTDDRRTLGLGRGLVVVQVALTLVLVVAATFFAATLRNLRDRDLGFRDGRVVTFNLDADGTDLEGEPLTAVHRQILDRLRALPGVERVTLGTITPLSGNNDGKPLSIPGFVPKAPGDMAAQVNTIGPDYLDTFGIRLLRGRTIGAGDTTGSPRVALVSQGAARHFFPGVDALGRAIEIRGATTTRVEIVGIVADVHDRDVRTDAARMFYVPFFQRHAEGEYTFAVRTVVAPAELMRMVRRELRAIVPQIPVPAAQTLSRRLDERLGNERLLSSVATLFGGLALLLAGVGIYGLVGYGVARRTPEIGLRLALGATRSHVVWLVTRNTIALVALGVVLGVGVAVASRNLVTSLLFGLPTSDARVYAIAVAFLALVGAVASVPPVLRAIRLDPVTTLRRE